MAFSKAVSKTFYLLNDSTYVMSPSKVYNISL